MPVCYLARGCSGSGKSTRIRDIARVHRFCDQVVYICSTDDYWFDGYGNYIFRPDLLGEAHQWNFERFCRAIEKNADAVCVDNTNIRLRDLKPYAPFAHEHGYDIQILEPATPWAFDVDELVRRNRHGVPRRTIERMVHSYENFTKEEAIG